MLTRRRTFTVFFAIAAIAMANCIGPQMVLAGHHGPASSFQNIEHALHDHGAHSHDHARPHGTETDDAAGEDNAGSGLSKFCCSAMTCTAGGVLAAMPAAIVEPTAMHAVPIALDDMLWAFNAAAVDPPPRRS